MPAGAERYVGRFAPSPTGPLHLGSLLTAVASYLDARQQAGEWLVRIEDIDPPREVPGAADAILRTLEAFGLAWDREVLYQSTRAEAYRTAAAELEGRGLAYRCSCTRAMLRAADIGEKSSQSPYPGTCRDRHAHTRATAIRLRAPIDAIRFDDRICGPQTCALSVTTGDYVIFRRDGLPAYHLAVAVDDAYQRVTHIVRGADLLDATGAHIHLQRALGLTTPVYCHVPVIVNAAGQKLSKQTGARPVSADRADRVALALLRCLGLEPPATLEGAHPTEIWRWAIPRWGAPSLIGMRQLHDPTESRD